MRHIILGITLTLLNLILSHPLLAETKIHISDLNKGDIELVGELGPLEKDYLVVAEFAMFTPHGRAGVGGDLRMKVMEVDGKKLAKPLWLRYFKTASLEEYTLPDGTDIFAQNPHTHTTRQNGYLHCIAGYRVSRSRRCSKRFSRRGPLKSINCSKGQIRMAEAA
jgi:hypothetical protein